LGALISFEKKIDGSSNLCYEHLISFNLSRNLIYFYTTIFLTFNSKKIKHLSLLMAIIIIVILILLNGVFSMSEISLVSSKRFKLEGLIKKGSSNAEKALQLS
jgi:hypothetical protein